MIERVTELEMSSEFFWTDTKESSRTQFLPCNRVIEISQEWRRLDEYTSISVWWKGNVLINSLRPHSCLPSSGQNALGLYGCLRSFVFFSFLSLLFISIGIIYARYFGVGNNTLRHSMTSVKAEEKVIKCPDLDSSPDDNEKAYSAIMSSSSRCYRCCSYRWIRIFH